MRQCERGKIQKQKLKKKRMCSHMRIKKAQHIFIEKVIIR